MAPSLEFFTLSPASRGNGLMRNLRSRPAKPGRRTLVEAKGITVRTPAAEAETHCSF